ncbi:hypothetical protein CASFOL_019379 [Castilleja foliolosa]|uniref:CCHC-type domain-containing protein n=1 Tax=Castilleja foliolosa TaxID=1961234 RepID=A0ABD3D467_9LAMI
MNQEMEELEKKIDKQKSIITQLTGPRTKEDDEHLQTGMEQDNATYIKGKGEALTIHHSTGSKHEINFQSGKFSGSRIQQLKGARIGTDFNSGKTRNLKLHSPRSENSVDTSGSSELFQTSSDGEKKKAYVCSYCGKPGHVKSYCWKLIRKNRLQVMAKATVKADAAFRATNMTDNSQVNSIWVRKEQTNCRMSHSSPIPEAWYLDSGCSNHMTGDEEILTNITKSQGGKVRYGGCEIGQIIGRGTLDTPGMVMLKNVLLVKGLSSNLISVSRLCDRGFSVKFSREKYEVYNNEDECILTGNRTSNNCYQILGKVLCKKKAVKGLPKTDIKTVQIREPCQKARQACALTDRSLSTSHNLEPHHTDLTRPLKLRILVFKRYVLVYTTDLSHFTWTKRSNKKSEALDDVTKEAKINNVSYRVKSVEDDDLLKGQNPQFDVSVVLDENAGSKAKKTGNVASNALSSEATSCPVTIIAEQTDHAIVQTNSMIEPEQNGTAIGLIDRHQKDALIRVQELYRMNQAIGETDKILSFLELNNHLLIVKLPAVDLIDSTDESSGAVFVPDMFEIYMLGNSFYFHDMINQFLSQSEYAKKLVRKLGRENVVVRKILLEKLVKLSRDDANSNADNIFCRGVIGSSLLLIAKCPDITYTACLCVKCQSKSRDSYLKDAGRFIRYLASMSDFELCCTNSKLVDYTDFVWAGDVVHKKNTTGGYFFLGNGLISWNSKKENCIFPSKSEADFVAAENTSTKLLRMNQMIEDLGLHGQILTLLRENSKAIDSSKNPVHHSRKEHIDMRY